jgi:adenylosuccinate synthase
MTNATVVIGAGYGDEGKGRTVDFLLLKIQVRKF